jgi:hypothetical protein
VTPRSACCPDWPRPTRAAKRCGGSHAISDRPSSCNRTPTALYLAALLEGESRDVSVYLATDGWSKQRKPGERTHRRPNLAALRGIVPAIAALAREDPRPQITEQLARQDVIAFLRARSDSAQDDEARALFQSLEKQIAVREIPDRGPLADPELWAIETRLDAGQLDDVMDLVSAAERTRGRTPGTTYLRARASLALRAEPPKLIAERISALALSMSSFQELSLLAAEAWLECGDSRRAMPFARDLVDAPGIEEGLLLRAQRLLARAVGAAPDASRAGSLPPQSPSRAPPPPPRGVSEAPAPSPPAQSRTPSANRPQYISAMPAHEPRPSQIPSTPSPPEMAIRPSVVPRAPRAPVIDLEPPPPPAAESAESGASFTLDLPPTPRAPSVAPPPRGSSPPGARSPSASPRRRPSGVLVETRPPRSYDPRAEPEDDDDSEGPTLRKKPSSRQPSQRTSTTPSRPPQDSRFLAGASLPPYSIEDPAPVLTRAPLLPRPATEDEIAEHLTLPAGVVGGPKTDGSLPRSILEARVQFTLMSRELGLDYRLQRGITLRTDATSIEQMQQVLLEAYPDHVVRTSEEAADLERHGAFLSEILARLLDAQWFDISSNDLGFWAMIVPPDTRVWPFGRVARLVAMGTRERDLVSYFFELKSRARR